jgi:tetratricopeptide (TPR) repeat protein
MRRTLLRAASVLLWVQVLVLPLGHVAHAAGKGKTQASAAARAWKASLVAEAKNDFEQALQSMSGIPEEGQDTYMVAYRRGWLLYRLGRYDESAKAYRLACESEPASIESRVALMVPLMALTKWGEVADIAQEVLKRDPENYFARQRLALAKFNTQRFPEAEQLYRGLLQHYPSDVEMRAGLGWSVLRMGKTKEAIKLFTQVLELSAQHASAKAGLVEATTPAKATK